MCRNTKKRNKAFLHAEPAGCDGCMEQDCRRICRLCSLRIITENIIREEARMNYLNAKTILPEALVKELQTYAQGVYLYVPVDQAQQKRWGEVSGYRQELLQRNQQIREEYGQGISMEDLSEKYSLSFYAIRKIIYQK